MSSFRLAHLLLLALTLAILGSATTSAHRVLKGQSSSSPLLTHHTNVRAQGGCLNYGHSCLGAHGKRSSSNPGEGRSITPTLQPALPRPLLDILLDALSSATRPGAQSAAHSQFRQRIPSDFAAANAATRALLLEDVNEAGARAMADGNEDSGSFAYAPNGQETEDAVFVFSPVDDYSEARYRRDAGNASAKDVVFAKDETLPKDSELEEKEGEDVALEVTRDGKRRMSTRAAQPRRIVDLHILANWVRR